MPRSDTPHDWLRPRWPAPPGVQALCTTRAGGASSGRHASLNLGAHVGDDPGHVASNRVYLSEAIGADPVFLRQVHGTEVLDLDDLASYSSGEPTADACIASRLGLACTVMVADCLPVLLCTADGARVGAVHAGWRGLAAGVIEAAIARIRRAAADAGESAAAGTLHVWLGPCIGPGEFEVGPEVKAAFESAAPSAARCFRPAAEAAAEPGPDDRPKWLADLPALARQRLAALGEHSVHGNDGSDAWCTVRQPSRFFSHRRDGVTGRFAASVWRT
ncbi:MAG: peptidoglycan editing factor PgeF [Comamonadaceae bacterium]|nr:MAG: peptidoglycan editing factor PgeF [Comamonadaceae bacterium]